MKKSYRGILQMLAVTFIWGSVPLFGIWSALPSAVFVFFRVFFALPFLLFFTLKKISLKEFLFIKPFWAVFISGLMLGLNWVFFFWALQKTNVATVVILYYMGPIFSLILAIIFLKEPFNRYIFISLILALFGVLVSFNGEFKVNFGLILALLASLCYGLLGFFSKLATKHHSSLTVTAYQILVAALITAPFLFMQDWHLSIKSFIIVLIAGVVHTALALFLWYDALRFIKVSTASILQYLDIFFTIFLAYIFLGQNVNLAQIIGATLIVLSGVVVSLEK